MTTGTGKIRAAAGRMVADHGPGHPRREMWEALAGLLLDHADSVDLFNSSGRFGDKDSPYPPAPVNRKVLAVAEAYLGAPG